MLKRSRKAEEIKISGENPLVYIIRGFFFCVIFAPMPTIARKARLMPASPIRKLTPYADKAKADGKIVYHLNIGQPDIHTPEGMLAAIKKADFKVWAYTPSE